MLTDTGTCIGEMENVMKKTAIIVKMVRPVKNGMYTDKYTVTYESGVTRTFKIVGGMIKSHLDFMMSADVKVIRTESGKHTSDVFTQPETIEPVAAPETNAREILSTCSAIIATAEKFKKCLLFSSPKNATGRRSYEKLYSIPETEFVYGGDKYTVEYNVTCSCSNVYAKGYYTRNGEKITLRTIKKIAAEITAAGVTII